MSFEIGNYITFLKSKQVSLVVDKSTHPGDKNIIYRTRILVDRLGYKFTYDSQEQTWHYLSFKHARIMSPLEIELL